jgi:hypothetical protein
MGVFLLKKWLSLSHNVPGVCEVAEGNLPSQASNGERQAEAPAVAQHIHHVELVEKV